MPISINPTLTLVGQKKESTDSDFVTVSTVVIEQKNFDADQFQGVGYQRIFVSNVFGDLGGYGIGFSGASTALQVNAFNLALPLYRFDFAFNMDSDKLGEVVELYSLQYNYLANNSQFKVILQDTRLIMSEPVDAEHSRNTLTLIEDNSSQGWIEKRVEYEILFENIEWSHKVGDFYGVNLIGTEISIVTDQGENSCLPDETGFNFPDFDGFEIEEIVLPAILGPAKIGRIQAMGFSPGGKYFAQAFTDTDPHFFCCWEESDPVGTLQVRRADLFATEVVELSDPTFNQFFNSYVLSDQIVSRDVEEDSSAIKNIWGFYGVDAIAPTLDLALYHRSNTEIEGNWQRTGNFTNGKVAAFPNQIYTVPLNTPLNIDPFLGPRFTVFEHTVSPNVNDRQTLEDVILENRLFIRTGNTKVDTGRAKLAERGVSNKGTLTYARPFFIDSSSVFSLKIRIHAENAQTPNPGIGHGFGIVFHNDSRGTAAFGLGGDSLGFGGNDPASGLYNATDAIQPSIAIALDNYHSNPNFPELADDSIEVVEDGDFQKIIAEVLSPQNWDVGGPKYVWVDYNAATQVIAAFTNDVDVKPVAAIAVGSIDLPTKLGGVMYITLTASSTATHDSDHVVYDWSFATNARSNTGATLGSVTSTSLVVWDSANEQVENKTSFGLGATVDTLTDAITTTVSAPRLGNNVFYHRFQDTTNPLNQSIEKGFGLNFTTGNTIINSVTDGSIPGFLHGIQANNANFKFYLTQGPNVGSAYVTEDWLNFTYIGDWNDLSTIRPNEGQLYYFRDEFIVSNASRFFINQNTDTLVDSRTLLCPAELGTAEEMAIYNSDRDIMMVYATNPEDSGYTIGVDEQVIICTRDNVVGDDFRCFRLTATDSC